MFWLATEIDEIHTKLVTTEIDEIHKKLVTTEIDKIHKKLVKDASSFRPIFLKFHL